MLFQSSIRSVLFIYANIQVKLSKFKNIGSVRVQVMYNLSKFRLFLVNDGHSSALKSNYCLLTACPLAVGHFSEY